MKILGIRFTKRGLMRVEKCDGETHWKEDMDYHHHLVKDSCHKLCTCSKCNPQTILAIA